MKPIEQEIVSLLKETIGYAFVDQRLMIRFVSPNFYQIFAPAQSEVVGEPIIEVIEEFVGLEMELLNILRGEAPELHLHEINREGQGISPQFFDFHISAFNSAGLLIVVENRTRELTRIQSALQDLHDLEQIIKRLSAANRQIAESHRSKSKALAQLSTFFKPK
ncbi:MAG: hypothetical protein QNJ45_08205 [Ardenticatenaceae bacterium]|nr:hypothetical protein [Ardenticatenaceae bacterium]